MPHSVIGSGGGLAVSSRNQVHGTLGQALAAHETEVRSGFWYVVNADRPAGIGVDHPPEPGPETFHLYPNYPNPFSPATRIDYDLAASTRVRLVVYNVLGLHVRTLVDGQQSPGRYSVIWDGRNQAGRPVSTGFYVYTLRSELFARTRFMLLVR